MRMSVYIRMNSQNKQNYYIVSLANFDIKSVLSCCRLSKILCISRLYALIASGSFFTLSNSSTKDNSPRKLSIEWKINNLWAAIQSSIDKDSSEGECEIELLSLTEGLVNWEGIVADRERWGEEGVDVWKEEDLDRAGDGKLYFVVLWFGDRGSFLITT